MKYVQHIQVSKHGELTMLLTEITTIFCLMCHKQVHFNNHTLTALPQHNTFHNTSNKNKHVQVYITRHENNI